MPPHILLLLSTLTPLGAQQPAPLEQPHAVYAAGAQTTFDALIRSISRADVVFIGEEHDHKLAHELELAVLRALKAARPRMGLSLEMFERDVQLVVDEYLAGHLSETAFLAASRPWPNYKSDYRPLVEFCKENRLPVCAANVPRRYVNMVSRGGQATLLRLSRGARAFLPRLPYPMDLPADYAKRLDETFTQPHGAEAPGMPTVANLKEAQGLWDCGMADSIVRFRRKTRADPIVHVCGSMHSDRGHGIVDRLRRQLPGIAIATVSVKRDRRYPQVDRADHDGIADFVVVGPDDRETGDAGPPTPTPPAR